MNILVINGSPKGENSNTMKLTRAFLDGAGWTDAEIIDISKITVEGCTGCYFCWTKTPGKCTINDDMDEILPKLVSANVIIWSFPLYSCGFPGNLKNFMDRRLPLGLPFMDKKKESGGHQHRFDLSSQRHILISTCGYWTTKGNYDGILWLYNRSLADRYESIFFAAGDLFSVQELKERTDRYLEIVRKAGAEYAQSGRLSEKVKLELSEPFFSKEEFEKGADNYFKSKIMEK